MKKKSLLYISLITLLFGVTIFLTYKSNINLKNLSTDSGFDSDWDSGWDSGGSDWGSSYDSDWGSSSNYSSDYSGDGELDAVEAIMILIFIVYFIATVISDIKKTNKKRKNLYDLLEKDYEEKDIEVTNKILKEIPDFNKEEFLNNIYDLFVKVQESWTNFDYDALRSLLTDELYNTYKAQLKTLSVKGQKNIMTDFERVKILLTDFNKTEKEYTFKVYFEAKFYDYLVDKNNKVIRGMNAHRIDISYGLVLIRSISKDKNKCPNCGHPLKETNSSVCPYCNSTIINNNYDLVLSSKKALNQKYE